MEPIRMQARQALLGVGMAGLLLGCPSRTILGPEDFEPAARVVAEPVALPIPEPGEFDLVDADDPALRAAIEAFRKTGRPPVVRRCPPGLYAEKTGPDAMLVPRPDVAISGNMGPFVGGTVRRAVAIDDRGRERVRCKRGWSVSPGAARARCSNC